MTACESCRSKDRRIAQLERDVQQTAEAIDTLARNLLAATEKRKGAK